MVAVNVMRKTVALDTFEDVSRQARPYPSYLLPDEGTALALFAAGFMGWNDVVHFARKGLQVTCVDTDGDRLLDMAGLYPPAEFHVQDAWVFAADAMRDGRMWDVVSVDPFLGDAAEFAWDTLYLWVALARKMVTLTVNSKVQLNAPDGWDVSYFPRSGTAAWMVMTHA